MLKITFESEKIYLNNSLLKVLENSLGSGQKLGSVEGW